MRIVVKLVIAIIVPVVIACALCALFHIQNVAGVVAAAVTVSVITALNSK